MSPGDTQLKIRDTFLSEQIEYRLQNQCLRNDTKGFTTLLSDLLILTKK